MKNLFTNLMKNTAKSSQNTGGGASRHEALIIAEQFSQCQTSRSEGARQITARFESAQMKNTSLISGCSAVDVPMPSYGASDEHPMSTRSASDERRWKSRGWKYVACMLMVLVMSVGQMWGTDNTFSSSEIATETKKGNVTCSSGITSTTKKKVKNTSNIYCVAIGNAVDTATYTVAEWVQIQADANYTIDNTIVIQGAANGGDNKNIAVVMWRGSYSATSADTCFSAVAPENDSGTRDTIALRFPSGRFRTIRLYRRINYKNGVIGRDANGSTNQIPSANASNFNIQSITATATAAVSCSDPTAPTAFAKSSVTSTTATFSITDAANAASYDIYCSESSSTPDGSTTPTATGITTKTSTVTGLTAGTTYYAWVRAVCDGSHKSSWVALDPTTFTTLAAPTASFSNSTYAIGGSALDLSSLWSSNSAGSVTYSVEDAAGTGASVSTAAFSATRAGKAKVKAVQAANGSYDAITKYAYITVGSNATGKHTVTYDLEVNVDKSRIPVTDSVRSTSLYLTTAEGDTLKGTGVTYGGGAKSDLTGKISAPASYDGNKYVYVQFAVADGYTFTLDSAWCVVQPVSEAGSAKLVLSDNNSHTITGSEIACAKGSNVHSYVKNGSSVALSGTVKLKIYCYGASTGTYRLGEKINIHGSVAASASCTTSPTVTAGSNSSVTATTATVSCASGISSLGSAGCSISEYGFVIGTSTTPAIGGDGVTKHVVGTTTYTKTGESFEKALTGLTAGTTYYVRPYATNGNGTAYGTQTSFTTSADVTAPTLSSSNPANGATDVPTSGTIVLTFSESIASVDAKKFTLTNATKGDVAIDDSYDTKVNVAYTADPSTTVTLTTDAGAVQDAAGNASAALLSSISFTTAAVPVLTAISADVLYQAASMANITFTGADQNFTGLSSNYLFKVYGDATGETKTAAKGKNENHNVTDDISTKSFTSALYILSSSNTTSTSDPTEGAIEIITPSTSGLLYLYLDANNSSLTLKKKGTSTSTSLSGATYKAMEVDANTHYFINGSSSGKRGLYGIQYVSTYGVSFTGCSNVTPSGDETAIKGKAYTATFTANTGYTLPSDVTVTIGDVAQTKDIGYTWTVSSGTGTLTVPAAKVTGAISIAVSGVALPTHIVSYNGNGSTSGDAPTDANAYVEGADVTVLGKNTLVKTNNGFVGWNTAPNGSGTWRVQGETFSMGAADVALHAQWVPTANLTVGTLYTAGDMKAKAIGSSTGYRPGYSSNGIFELLGVGTADDSDLKNTPMEYASDSRTIDGTEFTHALNFQGQGAGSPSGTTLPTARAIKFHVGESGTLHLWVRAGSKINIVKDGGSASAVGSSTDRTHETVEVTAGTWYLYATGSSTSLYGMKLMTCTDPELAYGTTAVAKNYADDAFTNTLTKAAGASPAFSSDNPSVATVDGTGEVTIVGVGSTTITASISDDATYCDDEASYTLTVYPSYTVTYNAMDGTCGTESAVTELGKVTLPSATHETYTTYTWVTYDGAFVGYEGEEYEPSGDITLYAKWQGDCAAGGGSDGVLFSAEFKDSGLGTENVCTAANDPVTFTTDQLKAEPIGGSISAYTTGNLTHVKYVDNGVYLKGTDGVIKITLEAAINTNDLFEYVNVHSSNPNAYLRHTSASNSTDQIVLTGYNNKNVKVMLPAAFNGKKELYIVKQSTDFKLHKAAVVRPAFLMLLRDDTPNADTNLSGTDEALTTENYLEVIRGGSASYTSPSSGDLKIKRSNSKNYINFNNAAGYLKIVLNDALQEGDVIGFDSQNANELALTTTAERSTSIRTTSQLYTVGSSSPLKGQTTFYIWQCSGSSDYLRGLQIARSAVVGSSCYDVIYEGNGADGGYTNDPKAYDAEDNDVEVAINGYTRTGYEFVGWNTAADGSGDAYARHETISDIDDDVTLYAQWRILISSNNTNFSGYTSIGASDDVRVAGGATLTLTQDTEIRDITIETGSTLNIAKDGESGITVATNSLYLRGGWNETSSSYDMPRVYIDPASTLTKEVETVNYDISVDASNYYPFAVPFRVRVKDVDYANSTLASYSEYGQTGQYVIKEYDGASRAENGPNPENWKVVPREDEGGDVYLEPGRGYIMTAVSIPAYGGGVIRFPMTVDNAWTADGEKGTATISAVEKTKNTVEVTAYTGTAATANKMNAGWNMLGVPYMSCFGTKDGISGTATILDGHMTITGAYEDNDVQYVSVPVHDFSEYLQFNIADGETVLKPGWCFLIQAATTGSLTFAVDHQKTSSDLPIYAPKREQENKPTVKTGIILSGAEASDKTTILVSDKYSAAEYEINADLEKIFGNGYTLATYSLMGASRLAYNALSNADAANLIPIGYRAPEEGEYTFSINPRYAENSAFKSVNLIDYETGVVTDLMMYSYTFFTDRTQNDSRFAINVEKQKDTPTDVENVQGDDVQNNKVRKLLLNGNVYIIRGAQMYDVTGKRVEKINK